MPLTYDYTNMLAPACPGAPDAAALAAAAPAFAAAHAQVAGLVADGTLGFPALAADAALLAAMQAEGATCRGTIDDVVLLGIGGSALGPALLRDALRPPFWNALDATARDGWPRLHVLENVDPVTIDAVLRRLDLARTRVIVTSKSGGTAETLAQYLVLRARVLAHGGTDALRLVFRFVTDPVKGALRAIAREDGIVTFEVPPNVGGRFSVLSAVGLLPAACIGVDIAALLAGAEAMRVRAAAADLAGNPAALFAVLQWLHDTTTGRRIHVLMPYVDALRNLGPWFVQLWAESLGKVRRTADGRTEHVGPTPVPALGATDQHAQVQLFMEGPHDKTVTFLAMARPAVDVPIPALHGDHADLAYLGGHTIFELLDAERRATAGALASRGRPSATIVLPAVDAWHVGELLMLFEYATAYAGALYGIDAFDQPGVELGKRFTFGIFGRPGFEGDAAAFAALPPSDPALRV